MWGPETIENLPKIRQGNDFTFTWTIQRDGQPERLADASSLRLTLRGQHGETPIEGYRINENVISIDFTPEMLPSGGRFNIELKYNIADSSLLDGMRECTVDVDAFVVVLSTADADVRDLSATADVVVEEKEKMINTDLIQEASTTEKGLMTPAQYNKLNGLRESNLLAEYVHSGNREVRIERIDYDTNTFYSPNHGLIAGDFVFLVFGEILNFKEVCPLTIPYADAKGFAVRNITADSFQLSATAGSAIIDLIPLPTLDLTKWWFESYQKFAMRFNNIPYTNVVQVRYTGYGSRPFAYHYVSEEVLSRYGYKGDQNYYGQFVDHSLLMDVIVDVTVSDSLIFRVSQLRGLRYNSAGNIEVINTRQQDVRPRNRSAVGKWLQIEQSGGIANGTAIRVYKND